MPTLPFWNRNPAKPPHIAAPDRAFLPAALEIVETPPSPLGRATALTICAVVLVAGLWAAIGKVDIIAVASGKIIAPSHTQVIQPLEAGVVRAILVHAGQDVSEGQTLIALDDTNGAAELAKAKADFETAEIDQARLTALLDPKAPDPFAGLLDVSPGLVQAAKLRLASERLGQDAKLAALEHQRAEKQAELETAKEAADKDDQLLPLVQRAADIRQGASEIQHGDYLQLIEAQQQLIATQSDRRLQALRMTAANAAIAELVEQRQQTQAEFAVQTYVDLARARSEVNTGGATLAKAQYALDRLTLRSPLDGTVTQVNVHTVGAVVTPAEQLVSIVSGKNPIEIEAVLPNQEVGFVHPGQDVEVKVDAYPFTRYGLLKGKVEAVAQDAEALAQAPQGASSGAQPATDQTQAIEGSERLVYRVTVSLDQDTLLVDGKPAQLIPGMAVIAEIKTGQRTVLDLLLSPLSEYLHDSMGER